MNRPHPYRFLLAVDGSRHANRAAWYVARRAGALTECEIHVVAVHHSRLLDLVPASQRNLLLEAGAESIEARRILEAAGMSCRFHAETGEPALEIARLAGSLDCDEIVLGSRGLTALNSAILGSVAYKVAHDSMVPVTVVPNPQGAYELDLEDGEKTHRILLPVDGSAASDAAVDYACALRGARVPVEVRVLNVQVPIASGNVTRLVGKEVIDEYRRNESETALAPAREALQAAGISCECQMLVGHPAQTIVRDACHWGATRIVMGTRGYGAMGSLMVGSTALQVMHLAELPVTLVK